MRLKPGERRAYGTLTVLQCDGFYLIGEWSGFRQEMHGGRRVEGWYDEVADDPYPPKPEPVEAAPFEMTGPAKEAWKLQRELERDWMFDTDNPKGLTR
jgi:hypothetical protein